MYIYQRPSKFPEIEEVLRDWLSECRTKKQLIQDIAIRQKAREVAREMKIGEDKFKASAGWVENFKHRHGIKKGIWVGRAEPAVIMDDDSENEVQAMLLSTNQSTQGEFPPIAALSVESNSDNGTFFRIMRPGIALNQLSRSVRR